jgi:hypothetical protein
MLSNARRSLRGPAVLSFFLIAAFVAACGSAASAPGIGGAPGASAGPAAGGGTTGGTDEEPAGNDGGGTPNGNGSGNGNGNGSGEEPLPAPQQGLLIIKNGAIAIQVEGIDAALTSANQQMSSLGGYAAGSDRSGDDKSDQASVTYRIPAARWEEALASLRALGIKVLNERSSTEDVTTRVVDLGARIKNLQATETALQAVMTRATEIKDILTVQAELTKVREQIETLTAEKTNLEGLAAYSTLTVTFSLKPNPVLTEQQGFDPATEVDGASATLVGMLQGLATAGIWFGIVWVPILLGLAVIVAIGIWIFRRVARRLDQAAAASVPPAPTPSAGA